MSKIRIAFLAIFAFNLLAVPETTEAQDAGASPEAAAPGDVLEIATRYLETLYLFDWEALNDLVAEDVIFDDATSTFFGGEAWHFEGREEMYQFFKRSSQGASSNHFEILQAFSTGDLAVLTVEYFSQGDGAVIGAPGIELKLRVPAVTIVRVRDGKVVHHLDHVDYASMMQQVEAQKAGGS